LPLNRSIYVNTINKTVTHTHTLNRASVAISLCHSPCRPE